MRVLVLLVACLIPVIAAETIGHLSFTLPSQVPGNPEVTVHVAYPLDAQGQVDREAAADMVYYQGWWNEREFQKGGVYAALSAARFTVVGIFFEGADRALGATNPIDPHSGSLPTVEAALAETRTRLGLADLKPFACGHSSGASAVYWAAAAKPALFEAIMPIAGRAPKVDPPHVLMLHVQTWGDGIRHDPAMAWHRVLQPLGLSTMLTPPPDWKSRSSQIWLHLNSQPSIRTGVAWLRAVADLRHGNHGVMPPASAWPVQAIASQVAATIEPPVAAGETRPMPSLAVAERFAGLHRDVDTRDDPATGAQVITVRPRLAASRVVMVAIPSERSADAAIWDAALAADDGAIGIAIRSPRTLAPTELARLVAAARPADLPVTVIALGDQTPALAGLADPIRRVAIDGDRLTPPEQVRRDPLKADAQYQGLLAQALR